MNHYTFIIATRNDKYNSDGENTPMRRFNIACNHNIDLLVKAGVSFDFVVVNADGTKELEFIPEDILHDHDPVTFDILNIEDPTKYDTTFYETKLLNLAARWTNNRTNNRSSNRSNNWSTSQNHFLIRLDNDTLIDVQFAEWLAGRGVLSGRGILGATSGPQEGVYFSTRRELPNGITTPLDGVGTLSKGFDSYRDATVGCVMMPVEIWVKHRGYNETMMYHNHMEVEFLDRVSRTETINYITEAPFYHLWHPRNDITNRPHNRYMKQWDYPMNDENWGVW